MVILSFSLLPVVSFLLLDSNLAPSNIDIKCWGKAKSNSKGRLLDLSRIVHDLKSHTQRQVLL